jgi:hypothetical protein
MFLDALPPFLGLLTVLDLCSVRDLLSVLDGPV